MFIIEAAGDMVGDRGQGAGGYGGLPAQVVILVILVILVMGWFGEGVSVVGFYSLARWCGRVTENSSTISHSIQGLSNTTPWLKTPRPSLGPLPHALLWPVEEPGKGGASYKRSSLAVP